MVLNHLSNPIRHSLWCVFKYFDQSESTTLQEAFWNTSANQNLPLFLMCLEYFGQLEFVTLYQPFLKYSTKQNSPIKIRHWLWAILEIQIWFLNNWAHPKSPRDLHNVCKNIQFVKSKFANLPSMIRPITICHTLWGFFPPQFFCVYAHIRMYTFGDK